MPVCLEDKDDEVSMSIVSNVNTLFIGRIRLCSRAVVATCEDMVSLQEGVMVCLWLTLFFLCCLVRERLSVCDTQNTCVSTVGFVWNATHACASGGR
jgi:hypothetical protein